MGSGSYEVRTRAWSCSCAAFAFAAFNGPAFSSSVSYLEDDASDGHGRVPVEEDEMLDAPEQHWGAEGKGCCEWGGLMMGDGMVPVCKHLLASVLAEWWALAGDMVEKREVGREDLAGWAAGWGGQGSKWTA